MIGDLRSPSWQSQSRYAAQFQETNMFNSVGFWMCDVTECLRLMQHIPKLCCFGDVTLKCLVKWCVGSDVYNPHTWDMILFRETWRCPKHRVIEVFKKKTPQSFQPAPWMPWLVWIERVQAGPMVKNLQGPRASFRTNICHINDGMNHAGRKHCEMQRLILLKHPCNTGISSFGDMIGLTVVSSHGFACTKCPPMPRCMTFLFFFGLSLASQMEQQGRLLTTHLLVKLWQYVHQLIVCKRQPAENSGNSFRCWCEFKVSTCLHCENHAKTKQIKQTTP